jgi:uracil-DNA glycosylase
MIFEKFEHLFHSSWHKKLKPFIESKECDKIYEFLKSESKRGKQILPLSSNVWQCFLETSYDELKLVMVGLSPYHTMKDDKPVADGLLFGCSITNYPQPSLFQFYKAIETELYNGLNLHYKQNPDVSYLAHQGVLMLNASLTCELNKAGSHNFLWEPFMKFLFEEVISCTGVPVVFLGKEAAKLEKYVCAFTPIFKCSHPASAAYSGSDWDSGGMFKNVNKTLKDANNFKIQWLDVPADEYDEDREIPF